MLIIKNLSKMIKEEINDAEKYAKYAVSYKRQDPELAETFFKLANAELDHMNMLHDQVVRIIEDYKSHKGDPPVGMMAIYEYLHDEQIEDVSEVKRILSMY